MLYSRGRCCTTRWPAAHANVETRDRSGRTAAALQSVVNCSNTRLLGARQTPARLARAHQRPTAACRVLRGVRGCTSGASNRALCRTAGTPPAATQILGVVMGSRDWRRNHEVSERSRLKRMDCYRSDGRCRSFLTKC